MTTLTRYHCLICLQVKERKTKEMRVTINRQELFGYLKSMIRIVPQSHKVMELMGFLMECNEDDGFVYITASNLETTDRKSVV